MARGALGEQLGQVAAHHVDHMAGRFGGDEEGNLGPVAHRGEAVGRHLVVGNDQHRRLQRHDPRDPPLQRLVGALAQVGHFAAADDLYPVGVDVVQVADQVGGRACVAHGGVVEAALGVGMAGHPLPAQGFTMFFEQRFRADGRGLHGPCVRRPTSAAPSRRSACAARPHRIRSSAARAVRDRTAARRSRTGSRGGAAWRLRAPAGRSAG